MDKTCSYIKPMGRHTPIKLDFGKAEVCQFDVAFVGYKHVVWLQVPKTL